MSGSAPFAVAYCHCSDCKRWTGAPVAAFATFEAIALKPDIPARTFPSGATRRNCPQCGSPLSAHFPYLPGQIYVPLGILDNAADYPPTLHCHTGSRYPWLHLDDELPKETQSGRAQLQRNQK